MPSSPFRKPASSGRQVLWLVPLLLLLVVVDGLFPRAHHRPSGVAALRSEQPAASYQTSARPRSLPVVRVSLVPHARLRALPSSFMGLSTESWAIPGLNSDPTAVDRILGLLRGSGDGPLMLRIGGQSTEQTYFDAPKHGVGTEAYRPGTTWLKTLAGLARATRIKLLVDLNLVARYSPMAAAFAKALHHYMPAGSIADFEVGNEPDIGHRQVANPLAPPGEKVPKTPKGWDRYTSSQYISLFRSYASAVRQAVPKARMAGPEVFFAGKDADWIQQLVNAQRSRLGMLTVHRYPLSACTSSTAGDYATIARVLGQNASGGLANELVDAVHIAQRTRLPLRLSEFNSVTCGGRSGVSNTFATALWAADTLPSIWNVGVAGVNLHLVPTAYNTAFSVSHSGVTVHPLLYGMILFARAMGAGARLDPVRNGSSRSENVKVWAVRSKPNELKVLVLDKGGQSVNVALSLGSHATASVQRLRASSVAATSGVTLAGQHLGAQGQWLGRRVLKSLRPSANGTYTLGMPAYSGALLTLHL